MQLSDILNVQQGNVQRPSATCSFFVDKCESKVTKFKKDSSEIMKSFNEILKNPEKIMKDSREEMNSNKVLRNPENPEGAQNHSPIKYFLSGGWGGICTVVCGHPLDTIKVRLQTMPKPTAGHPPLYSGTFDCFKKTVEKEGFKGLYKGLAAPLVGVSPIFAVSFFGFGLGKKLFTCDSAKKLTKIELFLSGAFSGIFTTAVMAPGERIKTLLQVQQGGGPQKYSGPIDVVKQLYKEAGIKSIYKGTLATLLRDVPASGMYFMTYEWIKEIFASPNQTSNFGLLTTIFAGGMAGIANWVVGMPADVLKSRLQSAPEGTYPNGIRSVFSQLIKEEGPIALYKGFTPVMLRAFPANAACFIGVEFSLKFLNWCLPNL